MENNVYAEKSGIDIGLSVFFVIYALYMLITSIWVYSIIPTSCVDNDLRSASRGLLVTSSMAVTSFTCYGLCKFLCSVKLETHGQNPYYIPTSFLLFVTGIIVAILIFQSEISSELSSDSNCYTEKVSNFKQFNTYGIIGSVLLLIILLGVLGYRTRNWWSKLVLEKKGKLTRNIQHNRPFGGGGMFDHEIQSRYVEPHDNSIELVDLRQMQAPKPLQMQAPKPVQNQPEAQRQVQKAPEAQKPVQNQPEATKKRTFVDGSSNSPSFWHGGLG